MSCLDCNAAIPRPKRGPTRQRCTPCTKLVQDLNRIEQTLESAPWTTLKGATKDRFTRDLRSRLWYLANLCNSL